ncbi:12715_t:CDS:1, partial [Racocetra fulgida]
LLYQSIEPEFNNSPLEKQLIETLNKNNNDIQGDNNIQDSDDNINCLLYSLDKVYKFIANQFQNAESLNELVKLSFEIKLKSNFVNSIFPNQQEFLSSTFDPEKIKKKFTQLANILLMPLESGSGYYWEL